MNSLLEYFLRVTLVLVLAYPVTWALRRQSAALRHVIWLCAFAIAAATPLLMMVGPKIRIEGPAPALTSQVAVASFEIVTSEVSPRSPVNRGVPIVGDIWIAGMAVFALRAIYAVGKVRALLKSATTISTKEFRRVAETGQITTALTLGIFRPWILLPKEHREWEPEKLRGVLAHELAHIERRDCLVQWLPNLVRIVNWFNPLVWLARSEMLCESERACDDAVIRSGAGGIAFARNLIDMAQSVSPAASLVSTALTTQLERRIARLIDPSANRRPLSTAGTIAGAVFAIALLAPIAGLKAEQVMKPPVRPAIAQAIAQPPHVVAQVSQAQAAQEPVTQPAIGSLSGFVDDPSGAVVANATVRIHLPVDSNGTQVGYSTRTGPTGQWSFASIPAGRYAVEVEAPGFKTFTRAVAVSAGVNSQLRADLEIGRTIENLTITAAAPSQTQVQTSSGKPVRVSGGVQPARLLRRVAPVYPPAAREKGIQGSVTFNAVVDKAGFIANTQLVSLGAPPDLVQAAEDAIKQWQFEPTLLNGEPVEILTEVTVNFTLQ